MSNNNVTSWNPTSPLSAFSASQLAKLKAWGSSEEYALLGVWFNKQIEFNLLSSLLEEKEKMDEKMANAKALRIAMSMVQSLPSLADRQLQKGVVEEKPKTEDLQ